MPTPSTTFDAIRRSAPSVTPPECSPKVGPSGAVLGPTTTAPAVHAVATLLRRQASSGSVTGGAVDGTLGRSMPLPTGAAAGDAAGVVESDPGAPADSPAVDRRAGGRSGG